MKTNLICPVCKEVVGKFHGSEAPSYLHDHMIENHPAEYQEIAEVRQAVEKIEAKYRIYARDFFYYSSKRLWEYYVGQANKGRQS